MIQNITIAIAPAMAENERAIRNCIAEETGISLKTITGFHVLRQSIDARSRQAKMVLQLEVYIDEPVKEQPTFDPELKDVSSAPSVLIVGAGPAGLFAALFA